MKAALTGSVRAVALFQRAVAIDPDFALAHAQAGFRYGVLGESALARQSLQKAYQLRDRASDAERFFIDTLYDRDFTGNLERERRTLETWAESYPRDARPHTLLAGLALLSTGQHELAIAEAEKAIALDPDAAPSYGNRAFNQLMLNRLDDVLLTVRRAAERKLESAELLQTQYFVAFLTGNENELRRTATAARKSPATEDIISHIEALVLARSGQLARRGTNGRCPCRDRSEVWSTRTGRLVRSGQGRVGSVLWECRRRQAGAARALELGRGGREVDYAAAFALALAGDLPQSRALAEDLAREFPEDTSVQFMYLPTLRALFSLNTPSPDAAAAIQALQIASRYDLAPGRLGFIGRFGGLYPIYVRGLAHLAARQPVEAAAEFQRILDHRSIVIVDPMDAMARLQLARALALSGNTVKAKRAYDDLLTLWKDADPEIPVLEGTGGLARRPAAAPPNHRGRAPGCRSSPRARRDGRPGGSGAQHVPQLHGRQPARQAVVHRRHDRVVEHVRVDMDEEPVEIAPRDVAQRLGSAASTPIRAHVPPGRARRSPVSSNGWLPCAPVSSRPGSERDDVLLADQRPRPSRSVTQRARVRSRTRGPSTQPRRSGSPRADRSRRGRRRTAGRSGRGGEAPAGCRAGSSSRRRGPTGGRRPRSRRRRHRRARTRTARCRRALRVPVSWGRSGS